MPERFDIERHNVGQGWQHILDVAASSLDQIAPNWDAVKIMSLNGKLKFYIQTGDNFHTGKTAELWAVTRAAERRSTYTDETTGVVRYGN